MHDVPIESICIKEGESVLAVIRCMDDARVGYALVTDADGRLVGMIVDSDIRRALIRGEDLSCPAADIMTRDFISVPADADAAYVVGILQGTSFATHFPRVIPALDHDGRPVAIYRSAELLDQLSADVSRKPVPHKVLVIGGGGYIGSVLVRRLLASGYGVVVLDRLFYGKASLAGLEGTPNMQFVLGDTRRIDDLVPAIQDADAVVHLAELVGDPVCAYDPTSTLEINFLATSMVARICSYLQVNRLVYMSSCSVYGAGSDPDEMLDEGSTLAPVSLYAKTKINCERAIMGMSKGNFSPCILRLATVFGMSPRPRFDLVVNAFSAQAVADGRMEVFGGGQWRPHIHVSDVVGAICAALEAPIRAVGNEVFNIVGTNQRIIDVAETVKTVVPDARLSVHSGRTDLRDYRVSGQKAEKVLGFKAKKNIAFGAREIAEAMRSGIVKDYRDPVYHNVLASGDEGYGNDSPEEK